MGHGLSSNISVFFFLLSTAPKNQLPPSLAPTVSTDRLLPSSAPRGPMNSTLSTLSSIAPTNQTQRPSSPTEPTNQTTDGDIRLLDPRSASKGSPFYKMWYFSLTAGTILALLVVTSFVYMKRKTQKVLPEGEFPFFSCDDRTILFFISVLLVLLVSLFTFLPSTSSFSLPSFVHSFFLLL